MAQSGLVSRVFMDLSPSTCPIWNSLRPIVIPQLAAPGSLLWDRGARAQPGDVGVVRGGIVMSVIIGRKGLNRPLVLPCVPLDVPVGKRNHPAVTVRAVREIKKSVIAHFDPEVRPTNAVRIDVLEKKNPSRQRGRDLRLFRKSPERRREPAVPRTHPAQITIHRVAPE